MRILVTGATGFIGPAVVQALVDAGATVRVLEREPGTELRAAQPAKPPTGDMTDAESLRSAVGGVYAVVHLVAILTGKRRGVRAGDGAGNA